MPRLHYLWRNKRKDPDGKDASGAFVYGYDAVKKKMRVHDDSPWRTSALRAAATPEHLR